MCPSLGTCFAFAWCFIIRAKLENITPQRHIWARQPLSVIATSALLHLGFNLPLRVSHHDINIILLHLLALIHSCWSCTSHTRTSVLFFETFFGGTAPDSSTVMQSSLKQVVSLCASGHQIIQKSIFTKVTIVSLSYRVLCLLLKYVISCLLFCLHHHNCPLYVW